MAYTGWEHLSSEATELLLFIENDGEIYRQRIEPITKNLAKKKKKGVYQETGAVKLWLYAVIDGAKKYAKEFATAKEWSKIFPPSVRLEVAKQLAKRFEEEYRLGNYN